MSAATLLEYIPQVSPNFRAPYHLHRLDDLYARILRNIQGGPAVRALVVYPIRHYKTETMLHGALWLMSQVPDIAIVLIAFDWDRVKWLGKRLRDLAERTDHGPVKGHNEIHYWRNRVGGSVLVMSPEQSREGFDCHVLLVDDPISEHQYKDPNTRDLVEQQIDLYSARCMRTGKRGSVVVTMSRQGTDDPIARYRKRMVEAWEYFYQPAIEVADKPGVAWGSITDGEPKAFAPDVWDLPEIIREREVQRERDPTERWFWSRMQGIPRDQVDSQFKEPSFYSIVPEGCRRIIGLDMSWSGKKRSDLTAMAVIASQGGNQYVLDMIEMHFDFQAIESTLRSLMDTYQARIFSYMAGPERSLVAWGGLRHIGINAMHAGAPKFVRARGTVDRWNAGALRLPTGTFFKSGMRVQSFIDQAQKWTGNEGERDDTIDALVSASDAGLSFAGGPPKAVGQRRMR